MENQNHDAIHGRRAMLQSTPNPDNRLDYVIDLEGDIGPAKLELRYVPDRLILTPDALNVYLDGLAEISWSSIEDLGITIRDDIGNEVVPRWLHVALSGTHRVTLEDRQPRWDNQNLLRRLKLY